MSRSKGARGEREVSKILQDHFPDLEIRRGIQNRTGGDASDVEGSPLHVEVKYGKKVRLRAALDQAVQDSQRTQRPPVVIAKEDRKEHVVYMRLSDFLPMAQAWWKHKIADFQAREKT